MTFFLLILLQLGNIQTMWVDFWMFSTPSPLCGWMWSFDQPPLESMWIFILAPPPFISKILGFFWNFWIQILHRFDSSVQMFFQDLLIPNCLVFTSIWVYKVLETPLPLWIYVIIWRTPPPPCSSIWFMDLFPYLLVTIALHFGKSISLDFLVNFQGFIIEVIFI